MPRQVVCPLHKNQPGLAFLRCAVKLALGRRHALVILKTVFLPEQADIDGATVNLVQVNLVCTTVAGR